MYRWIVRVSAADEPGQADAKAFKATQFTSFGHVTATHCTTVSYHKDGTVFSLTGGVYAREKGRYTERIDHGIEPGFTVDAAAKSFTGKREHTYEYTFSDDVLYLTMQHKDGIKRDEVWQRVSPIAPGESKPVAKP